MSIRAGAIGLIAAILVACPQAVSSAEPRTQVAGIAGRHLSATLARAATHVTLAATKAERQLLALIPASPYGVSNCIPFGDNVEYGFTGFIYRNVPAFHLLPHDKIRFDLGNLNAEETRRDIYFAAANKNPAPTVPDEAGGIVSQDVRAIRWQQVVTESQLPASPHGDTIVGNYELTYTAEAPFKFRGGGLIIGFASAPPARFVDPGCEQVGVVTKSTDASGYFYGRFCLQPHLTLGALDAGLCGSNGIELQGVVIDTTRHARHS